MNINFTPRQFVNTAAGEKVTEYEAMSLINGINEALKNPDGYDANLIAEYKAIAGTDNKLSVAEAEKWLADNGKTYEDVYNYNSQFIYNLFTNNENTTISVSNNLIEIKAWDNALRSCLEGEKFDTDPNNTVKLIGDELFNYLKNNDFKASDIDTLIAGCKALNGASAHDIALAKNMLTNLFNSYANKYGDSTSFSFGDLKVLQEEQETRYSIRRIIDTEFLKQTNDTSRVSDEIKEREAKIKNELVNYLVNNNNIQGSDIDTIIANINASLKTKGITLSPDDLNKTKIVLTNLYNASSAFDGDNTSMSLNDLINYGEKLSIEADTIKRQLHRT